VIRTATSSARCTAWAKQFFFEKRTKKLLSIEPAPALTKVFCFFFSKKKSFLALPTHHLKRAPCPAARRAASPQAGLIAATVAN
jgi:hypothetical protein